LIGWDYNKLKSMHINLPLTQIALVVLCALACGLLFQRLKQPAVLGYVLAGAVLGSTGLFSMQGKMLVSALAELGVFLLMFVLGLELNLRGFKEVWAKTMGIVLLQFLGSWLAIFAISILFDWSLGMTFLLACVIALSSTAAAIKMLETMGELTTSTGRITIGILIAQDLAFVPMVIVIQGLGGEGFSYGMLAGKVFLSIGILAAVIWYLSRDKRLAIPYVKKASQHPDLLPVLVLTFFFGLGALAGLIGLSAAYGAFLAGLVLGNSVDRHVVVGATRPIQSTLLMTFFLSIGLLIDWQYILEHWVKISLLLLLIAVGKTVLNASILHAFKKPWSISFLSSLMLAQIGEFSFVLADTATESGLLKGDEKQLVISLTVLSLMFSPIWVRLARHLQEIGVFHHVDTFKQTLTSVYGVGGPFMKKVSLIAHKGFLRAKVLLEILLGRLKSFKKG
jgi:CPA2 family monovalent cation:H+ antiporter-2